MIKTLLLSALLLLSVFGNAQIPNTNQTYKGIFFSVGKLQTNSLKTLNETMASLPFSTGVGAAGGAASLAAIALYC